MEYWKETFPTVLEVTRLHRYSRKTVNFSGNYITDQKKTQSSEISQQKKLLMTTFNYKSVGSTNTNNGQKIRQSLRDPPDVKSGLIWKEPDVGKDWRQEGKGMAEDEMAGWHQIQWTLVWRNSGSWWWTGRPDVLRFMGSQRVRHDWVTELNWIELNWGKSASRLNQTECLGHYGFRGWFPMTVQTGK